MKTYRAVKAFTAVDGSSIAIGNSIILDENIGSQLCRSGFLVDITPVIPSIDSRIASIETTASMLPCLYDLGTPEVATEDAIVLSADMKNGAYTIAGQPDVPRNITVTRDVTDTADTPGTITITGLDAAGADISEVVVVGADGVAVAGEKAFASISSIIGAGWVIDAVEGSKDAVSVGVGTAIGLPISIASTESVKLAILGTSIAAANASVGSAPTVAESTVDLSGSTYNGSKKLLVFVLG